MSLPMPPNKSRVNVYWCTLGIFAGCIGGLILMFINGLFALPAAIILFLFVYGLKYTGGKVAYGVYKRWNKIVSAYSRLARGWVSILVFILLYLAGRTGSILDVSMLSPHRTMWKEKHFETAERNIPDYSDDAVSDKTWVSSYLAWVRESNNWWAIFLLPYLKLIDMFKSETYTPSIPRNTYTLY
jgi:hypothetical protein